MSSAAQAGCAAPNLRSVDRFHLKGPSIVLDGRIHAVRRDLADIVLADRVFAPHYARADLHRCGAEPVAIRTSPSPAAAAASELLPGEGFAVLEISGGWAWGYCAHDHYVGYVPHDALTAATHAASHVVVARSALVFSEPEIKSPLLRHLPIGSRLSGSTAGSFLALAEGGFVHLRHLAPADVPLNDPVAVAEGLLGMPYLWGGRGGRGIDCSGLVQLAFGMCGTSLPRDSDQQRQVGVAVPHGADHQRGDILLFPGHVGLMIDSTRLIHANAHRMAVTIEPLVDVVDRLLADHEQPLLARRRVVAA